MFPRKIVFWGREKGRRKTYFHLSAEIVDSFETSKSPPSSAKRTEYRAPTVKKKFLPTSRICHTAREVERISRLVLTYIIKFKYGTFARARIYSLMYFALKSPPRMAGTHFFPLYISRRDRLIVELFHFYRSIFTICDKMHCVYNESICGV